MLLTELSMLYSKFNILVLTYKIEKNYRLTLILNRFITKR